MHKEYVRQLKGESFKDPGLPSPPCHPFPLEVGTNLGPECGFIDNVPDSVGRAALGAPGLTLCRPSSLLKRQQHLPCTVFTPCWLLGAASWGGHTSHPVGRGRLLLNAGWRSEHRLQFLPRQKELGDRPSEDQPALGLGRYCH